MKTLLIAILFISGAAAEARTFDVSSKGINNSPPLATAQMALDLQNQNQEAKEYGWTAKEIGVTSITTEHDGSVTVRLIVVTEPAGGYQVVEPVLRYPSIKTYLKAAADSPRLFTIN